MGDRTPPSDSRHRMGDIYRSLEYLPRCFQVFALFAALLLASIRYNPAVAWLAVTMHSSFGTEIVWSVEYQRRLELMTLNERLCLTLYGVALSALTALTYVKSGRDVLRHLTQESGMSSSRRGPAVIMCLMLACEGTVVLKEEAMRELSNSDSMAHFVLTRFRGFEQTNFDPRWKYANPHFLIQTQILKAFMMSFVGRMLPAMLLAFVYRSCRDMRRNAHAALRWHIMTVMAFRSMFEVYAMVYGEGLRQCSSWCLLVCTLLWFGVVNYVFGPSKRAGWTASTCSSSLIEETFRGIGKCAVFFFMMHLSILAVVVSVHVVELLLIWLMFFLLTVWIPAIIDSCAVSYILCITSTVSFVAYKMDYTTRWGSLRLVSLLSLWWLDICILYSLAANVTRSRYGGVVAVLTVTTFNFRSLGSSKLNAGGSTTYFEACVDTLRSLVEEATFADDNVFFGYRTEISHFSSMMLRFCEVTGCLIALTGFLDYFQTSEARAYLASQDITLVTPVVLFRKLVRALILVLCFLVSIVVGLVMYRLVPKLTMYVPDFVAFGVAAGVACATLGRLVDLQEPLYNTSMRLIGVMEPPTLKEDNVLDEGYSKWRNA
uniref:Uncharacterized protein n=1 Tax=Trypanosoma congolense (strain IL3000) TaxID=1068625 RepID=G0UKV9_TRYCI|nr:conserved hypothetical protein [Trypanosoma congolense IL3000]